MATVNIIPLPAGFVKHARRWWPGHPPIFDGEPTVADRQLARELWAALDPDSREWYARHCPWLAEPPDSGAPRSRKNVRRKETGAAKN
jgi:hypothetical protein